MAQKSFSHGGVDRAGTPFKAGEDTGSFVPFAWVMHGFGFPGDGCGVSFWVWGTLVEWAFVLQGLFMGTVIGVWGLEFRGLGFNFFPHNIFFGISHRAWWRTPCKNYSCAERSNPDS